MKREILFRGKSTRTGDWVYGGIVHQTDYYGDAVWDYYVIDGTTTQDYDIGYEVKVIPETVGQYIGLRDRNEKKIFEGDVVTACFRNRRSRHKFSVCFDDGMFLFCNKCVEVPVYDIFSIEVIGNIHDNPELIGGVEDG